MNYFDPRYNIIPKAEIHLHLEGAIRTQTLIDVAREYHLALPSYDPSELDSHVKVYDHMRDLNAVLEAFTIFQNSITSPQVVERIAWELFDDSARQNIKLLEVRFSPDWAFHGHHLDWDACLDGLLRAQERAERELDMAIGYMPSLRATWDLTPAIGRWTGLSVIADKWLASTWLTAKTDTPSCNSSSR